MAFSDHGEVHRDVMHLLESFDHVHWQLDVFWTDLGSRGDVGGWLDRYDEGIGLLVRDFGSALDQGRVLGMVPFIPLFRTLLTGKPHHLWCGSGADSFAIMTSGDIEACPIAPELGSFNVGNISMTVPGDIAGSMAVGPPCTDCDILWVCGGRCLFSNRTMGWGREWFDRVCLSTRRMVEALGRSVPRARELIEAGILPRDAFDYPELNNGCEIIP
jgi:radical SAM protein with 4Fe4S-binding SPASM domain